MNKIEATGSPKIATEALDYVRRGGTLLIYGVYDHAAIVSWPPSKIFGHEITVCLDLPASAASVLSLH